MKTQEITGQQQINKTAVDPKVFPINKKGFLK